MSTPVFILVSFAAVYAVAAATAVVLIGGSLTVAAILPRGHPQIDHLREFASTLPSKVWRWTLGLESLLGLGALVLFTYLTLAYS